MKKIIALFFIVLFIAPASTFAEENLEITPTSVIPTVTTIANPVEKITTTDTTVSDKKEQIQYDYYFSPTCGWCQKLNKFFDKNNAFEKLNINKIDVNDHAIEFMNVAESLGESRPGTPFIVYEENGQKKYIAGGFYKIVDYFSKELGVDSPVNTPEEKKNNSLYTILLGLLIIVGPLAYLSLKK